MYRCCRPNYLIWFCSCSELQRKSIASIWLPLSVGSFSCGLRLYRVVFPVADDLFQVEGRVQKEVFSELVPVHHHGPVDVHAEGAHKHL